MIPIVLLSLAWVPDPADSLRVSEIHYAPSDPTLEFVEVQNVGSSPVDGSGLTLSDSRDVPSTIPAPAEPIPPGGRLVLVRDAYAFSIRWPGIDYVQVSPWPALNNDGDDAVIRFDGREMDRVSFSAEWGRAGVSLERRDPHGPSHHPINWGPSIDPGGATPGRQNSIHAPDRSPPGLQMADRVAPDTISILFDEPVDLSEAVIELDGDAYQAVSSPVDESEAFIRVNPGQTHGSVSARGVRDLFGNRMDFVQTPVAHLPGPGTLRIAEVLTKSDASVLGRFAFLELVSVSDRVQSIRGLRLQGPPDAHGIRREVRIPLLRKGLDPGQRLVLFDAGTRADADSLFRRAWPTSAGAFRVPIADWPLGVDPKHIRLAARRVDLVDEVRARLAWHDPALERLEGRSLERVDPFDDRVGPSAWTSSVDPSGATPGAVNRAEERPRGGPAEGGDLRITEVLYESNPIQPEFVEIVSRAPEAIDPNGVYLVYAPPDSEADSVRIGFAPDALATDDFLLLAWPLPPSESWRISEDLLSAFPSSAGRIPNSRVRPADRARPLRNDGATLILFSADGIELDRVDYGPALHHPAIRETRGIAIERIDWDGPSNEPTNWTSSTHPDHATPGYRTGPVPGHPRFGHGVVVDPAVFTPDGDESSRHVAVHVFLHDGSSVNDIRVYDLAGRAVRTLADGRLSNGADAVYWNGLDDRGLPAPTNPYIILVRSWDADGRLRSDRSVVVLARR